jgi:RNA polymerase sigma-70 factor (ECF subfamily)
VEGFVTFEKAWESHSRMLLNVIKRMLHGSPDAEDILQEVAVNAWRKWDQFDGRAKVGTWLYRIAVNETLMHFRKLDPLRAAEELSWDRGASPVHALDAVQIIRRIPHPDRQLLAEAYMLGMTGEELSSKYGVPATTMKSRLMRAKARCKRRLQ